MLIVAMMGMMLGLACVLALASPWPWLAPMVKARARDLQGPARRPGPTSSPSSRLSACSLLLRLAIQFISAHRQLRQGILAGLAQPRGACQTICQRLVFQQAQHAVAQQGTLSRRREQGMFPVLHHVRDGERGTCPARAAGTECLAGRLRARS